MEKNKIQKYLHLITLSPLLLPSQDLLAQDNKLEVSGFARLVAGSLDTSKHRYNGYEDKLTLSEHSLVAAQADYKFSNKLSATAQGLYHSAEHRKSGIEWAYLAYHHNKKLNLKAGKLRTPFFNYSDVIDVGFSYPWLSPPKQVYNTYMFSTFEGANISYNTSRKGTAYYLEAYWGQFDDKIYVDKNSFKTKVDNLRGLVANINQGSFSYRLSFHTGDVDIQSSLMEQLASQINNLVFSQSAQSLSSTGKVDVIQASINYDSLDYFIRSEWIYLKSKLITVPDITGYYMTAGYNFFPYTLHFTFADHDSSFDQPVDEIPTGISGDLDNLSRQYQGVFDLLSTDDVKSYGFGLRWDYSTNIAFKTEITRLSGRLINTGTGLQQQDVTTATMLQLGVEWIF